MFRLKQRPLVLATVSAMMAISPVMQQAWAASPVKLASTPVNQLSLVPPNILLLFDRSGSMDGEAVPDDMVGHDWSASSLSNRWVGFYYYGCNHLMFNPSITYLPPLAADGSSYPNATFTNAWDNGYKHSAGTSDLTWSYYYLYTGAGTAPTVWSDSRCKQNAKTGGFSYGYNLGGTNSFSANQAGALNATDQQNYANWYSYYRKRILMMKSAVGRAFNSLDSTYRTGLMTIDATASQISSTANSRFLPMATNDATHKASWYSTFYSLDPGNSTPLRQALSGAGRYFAGKFSTDPVLPHNSGGDCQQNFTIMATDGYWNAETSNPLGCGNCTADLSGNNIGNVDGPSGPSTYAPYRSYTDGTMDKNNDAGDDGVGNLSDVALYYYATNLRDSTYLPKVPSSATPAVHFSHMVTYTVGLGVAGTLNYVDDYATNTDGTVNDFVNIKSGTGAWPNIVNNQATTVDDLWHAAVNGRGIFFSAGDPASMVKGLNRALNDINSNIVHSTNFTSTSPVLSTSNNMAYKGYYQSGSWAGRLDAVLIDPTTGLEVPNTDPIWQGHTTLDTQAAGTGWDTGRFIFVGSGSSAAASPFRWASLSAAQKTVMQDGVSTTADSNNGASYGQWLLNYIRGDRSNEGTAGHQYFRQRGDNVTQGMMGDIVDAKPIPVGAPKELYTDDQNPSYSLFKTAFALRTPVIYAASNDGMVHAFNGSTTAVNGIPTKTATSGKEIWAYIPSMVIRSTNDESGKPDGLPAYAYPTSGVQVLNKPAFAKHYLVDGTPVVNDVDFGRTGGTTGAVDWRSLMVGGLGRGGVGYYALDVTNGAISTGALGVTTEAQAAAKYLWEFTGDSDMGYTYGNPVITRSKTYGWVVAVSSGYNNSTGNGAVWVLNAKDGSLIKKFQIAPSCGASSATYNCFAVSGLSANNPLNLGKMVGFVTSTASEEILSIYAGDMQGNLWRIDMSDVDKGNWTIKKLAHFDAPSGNGPYGNASQPITTEPTVAWDVVTKRRWVFVGTGMDLSSDDRSSAKDQANQQQSLYAIIDGTGDTPLPDASLPVTRATLAAEPQSSVAPISVTNKNGWYIDLAQSVTGDPSLNIYNKLAERVVLKPSANFGVVLFATNIPTEDVCSPGFTSNLYVRGYLQGQEGKSYLADASGNAVAFLTNGAGFSADPKLEQLANSATVFQTCDLSGACQTSKFNSPNWLNQSRISWRELLNQ